MDKATLRRNLFARIRQLTPEERREASQGLCGHLARDPQFLEASTIFAYLALPSEPDLSPLLTAFPEKRWAFARIGEEERLHFHALSQLREARPGAAGILEPDPLRHPQVDAAEAELILVPGVGFDPSTHSRLGRGKGHYDRFLARLPSPPAVGVCFSVQLTPLCPEAHDIPMSRLLTEQGWLPFE